MDFARKNLETAQLLDRENHYTDVIAFDIQQAIEKALKAIYAFKGDKIPRTHSLEILFNYSAKSIDWSGIDINSLLIISDYYNTERYPGPKYSMPLKEEIKNSIQLAKTILSQIGNFINSAS